MFVESNNCLRIKAQYKISSTAIAKDLFYQSVRTSLIKNGWIITHDLLYLNITEIEIYVDIVRVNCKFKY
jgi:hypothetical protein